MICFSHGRFWPRPVLDGLFGQFLAKPILATTMPSFTTPHRQGQFWPRPGRIGPKPILTTTRPILAISHPQGWPPHGPPPTRTPNRTTPFGPPRRSSLFCFFFPCGWGTPEHLFWQKSVTEIRKRKSYRCL